jgi:hypothetical protein
VPLKYYLVENLWNNIIIMIIIDKLLQVWWHPYFCVNCTPLSCRVCAHWSSSVGCTPDSVQDTL